MKKKKKPERPGGPSTKLEADIEREIVKYVEKMGGLALKLEVPSTRGYPDRLILLGEGSVFFIEVKKRGGRVSTHQERVIADLKKRGYNAQVVWSFEQFKKYLASVT